MTGGEIPQVMSDVLGELDDAIISTGNLIPGDPIQPSVIEKIRNHIESAVLLIKGLTSMTYMTTTDDEGRTRAGPWVVTASGGRFWPFDPRPEDILIADVAHALSNICRYTGHTTPFYSVAQHCVLVSEHVPTKDALWALMHDAPETWLGDVSRPVRSIGVFRRFYDAAEARIMRCVCEKLGLAPEMPESVSEADDRIIMNEKAALLPHTPPEWGFMMRSGDIQPLDCDVTPWPPLMAWAMFMARFKVLTSACP